VIVAADLEDDLTTRVDEIRAGAEGLDVVYEQRGDALPGVPAGDPRPAV
jgi:hypothetical protein